MNPVYLLNCGTPAAVDQTPYLYDAPRTQDEWRELVRELVAAHRDAMDDVEAVRAEEADDHEREEKEWSDGYDAMKADRDAARAELAALRKVKP